MNAEESYFLLLDDPAHFQLDYQALANWGRHSAGRQRLYRRRKDRALGRLPGAGRIRPLERIRPPCWEPPLLAAAQNW
ncbi:MAG: hypothetical protein ACLVJH_17615 [Faecalibacterium prausnitzii]